MAEIEDVNYKLGSIEATQRLILKSLHTIEDAYKETRDKVTLHGASNEAIWKTIEDHGPRIEALEDTDQQRKGAWKTICLIATGLATFGGIVGGWLAKVLGIL